VRQLLAALLLGLCVNFWPRYYLVWESIFNRVITWFMSQLLAALLLGLCVH
jgi:hypothetical protein